MKKTRSIKPRNNKEQPHGLWEVYYADGVLMFKCLYHNGELVGYEDVYSYNGKSNKKKYYV